MKVGEGSMGGCKMVKSRSGSGEMEGGRIISVVRTGTQKRPGPTVPSSIVGHAVTSYISGERTCK